MDIKIYGMIKANLTSAQNLELTARLQMVEKSGHTAIGSKTIALDGGKVQVINTINYTVDKAKLADVKKALGNDELFYSVFVPKPEVSESALKKLTAEQLEIVNEAIVSKPGTPQFKVVKTAEEMEE